MFDDVIDAVDAERFIGRAGSEHEPGEAGTGHIRVPDLYPVDLGRDRFVERHRPRVRQPSHRR